MLPTEVTTFTGQVSELAVDPAALEQVQQALTTIIGMMDDTDFRYMATIQQESFGGNNAAMTLAYHHGLAHQVMWDIIEGIRTDVQSFLTNVDKSAETILDVDANAGADLRKKHDALLGALNTLDGKNSGDAAYNHDRNHLHDPWATTPASAPAGQAAR